MRRIHHLARLGADFLAYGASTRRWWIPPTVLLLAVATLLLAAGQTAAPVALYPLF